MSLLKGVQLALFLSTASFAGLTLPFVSLGDKAVEIRVNYKTQFTGSLRDLAVPYMGGTMALSLSLGAATLGISGWRASRQERRIAVRSLQSANAQLRAREGQLQSLPFSESRLQILGLGQFLSEPISSEPILSEPILSRPILPQPLPAASDRMAPLPQARLSQAPLFQSHPDRELSLEKQSVEKNLSSPAQPLLQAVHTFSVQAGYQIQPVRYAQVQTSRSPEPTHVHPKSIVRQTARQVV